MRDCGSFCQTQRLLAVVRGNRDFGGDERTARKCHCHSDSMKPPTHWLTHWGRDIFVMPSHAIYLGPGCYRLIEREHKNTWLALNFYLWHGWCVRFDLERKHVFLIGNLTRDPELRYTPKGTPVCDISIAVNRTYTSEHGEKNEGSHLRRYNAMEPARRNRSAISGQGPLGFYRRPTATGELGGSQRPETEPVKSGGRKLATFGRPGRKETSQRTQAGGPIAVNAAACTSAAPAANRWTKRYSLLISRWLCGWK